MVSSARERRYRTGIQTADAIASELEGLQRAGLHGASATRICVEPGLVEDMRYMQGLKHREPWYLKAADLLCISPRVRAPRFRSAASTPRLPVLEGPRGLREAEASATKGSPAEKVIHRRAAVDEREPRRRLKRPAPAVEGGESRSMAYVVAAASAQRPAPSTRASTTTPRPPQVDLAYQPLRDVKFVKGAAYPGPCVEVGDPGHRLNTIAHEISEHPLVAAGGTAIVVTHGKPSADLIRSLQPAPGGIALPSYEEIKAGHYDGPPLHYTAVTALKRDHESGARSAARFF